MRNEPVSIYMATRLKVLSRILAGVLCFLPKVGYADTPVTRQSDPVATVSGLDELKAELQKLKESDGRFWVKFASPLAALFAVVVSTSVSYLIFVRHSGTKERRERAVELLSNFMTSEYFVKSRLVIQEYLLPTGSKYKLSIDDHGLPHNFNRLTEVLGSRQDANGGKFSEDREARYCIRAIPSFFWLVDQARKKGYISKDETLFNFHYTWYWTFILRFRIMGCKDNRLFQQFPWMLDPDRVKEVSNEYDKYVASLDQAARADWLKATNSSRD